MKTMQIVASGNAQGENLMEEYGYGFCGSELSNTSNMEDSVSNVLGDDEYSNFRLFGVGKATPKQVARKSARKEKRAAKKGGGSASSDISVPVDTTETADTAVPTSQAAATPAAVAQTGETTPASSQAAVATPTSTTPTSTTTNPATPVVTVAASAAESNNKILGLSKPVFYVTAGVAALIVGFVAFKIITKK